MAILPTDFRETEYVNNIWAARPSQKELLHDVVNEKYWVNVANRLKPGDEIRIVPEGMGYYARLLVLDAGKFGAKVHILQHQVIGENAVAETQESSEYEIKLRGPRKWSVLRKTDKAILAENLATQKDAEAWLDNHNKALAA